MLQHTIGKDQLGNDNTVLWQRRWRTIPRANQDA
jgi:hypothetical protein